jgi:hypothetical protein
MKEALRESCHKFNHQVAGGGAVEDALQSAGLLHDYVFQMLKLAYGEDCCYEEMSILC